MAIVIGVDEAGYGPNLGPLVIGFSVWQVPDVEADLYPLLGEAISIGSRTNRLTICDSKKMGGGIGGLETAVFASLAASQTELPATWTDLGRLRVLLPDSLPRESGDQPVLDWNDDEEVFTSDSKGMDAWNCELVPIDLPVECNLDDAIQLGERLRDTAASHGAGLLGIGVVLVHPWQFNRMLEWHGNKSRLLGAATMHATRHAFGLVNSAEPVRVICDRQGGRRRYSRLLRASFDGHDVSMMSESPVCSSYRLVRDPVRDPGRAAKTPGEFQIGFQVGGESNLPVALASMAAKYVRELAMLQWNRFWHQRIDGIHPTAGYPVDASRFRNDLRRHVAESEMPDHLFWRAK